MSLLSVLSVTHPPLFPLLLCSLYTPSPLKSHCPSHFHASLFFFHSTCVLLCSPRAPHLLRGPLLLSWFLQFIYSHLKFRARIHNPRTIVFSSSIYLQKIVISFFLHGPREYHCVCLTTSLLIHSSVEGYHLVFSTSSLCYQSLSEHVRSVA